MSYPVPERAKLTALPSSLEHDHGPTRHDHHEHAWFEERTPMCRLLVYVDDATSHLMQLLFVPTESNSANFAATRAYIERHGKAVAFYSDKASIFRAVPHQGPTRGSAP